MGHKKKRVEMEVYPDEESEDAEEFDTEKDDSDKEDGAYDDNDDW